MALTPEQTLFLEEIDSGEGKNLTAAQKAVLLKLKSQANAQASALLDNEDEFLNITPEGGLKPFMSDEQKAQDRIRRAREDKSSAPMGRQPLMSDEQKMQDRIRRAQEDETTFPARRQPMMSDEQKAQDRIRRAQQMPDATIPPLKKGGGGSVDVGPGPKTKPPKSRK